MSIVLSTAFAAEALSKSSKSCSAAGIIEGGEQNLPGRALLAGRSRRFGAVSIPTGHNLLGFLHGREAPAQLGHLLPHRIFHDLSFLDAEDELLRGCAFGSREVEIDLPGSGPILLEHAVHPAEQWIGFIVFAKGMNAVSDHRRSDSNRKHDEDAPRKWRAQVLHGPVLVLKLRRPSSYS